MSGSPYVLKGKVVTGNRIGRTLGIPTANLELDRDCPLLLAYGVYAVLVEWDQQIFKGMANIGIRPTMSDHRLTVEVNIFDFSKDIYGNSLKLYFIDRIRDEMKFPDLGEMTKKIAEDRSRAIEILSGLDHPDAYSQ